jgi:predicted glycosyltransferase
MKKYLFYLGHPAHYHNIAVVVDTLSRQGHSILLVARDKDVLFQLIQETDYEKIFLKKRKGSGHVALALTVLKRELKLLSIALKYRPNLMVGTDIVITHIGKLLNIPAIILNEDDSKEVPFLADYGFKYATAVISPTSCNVAPYDDNKIAYSGYHELAYLHPNYFRPDRDRINQVAPDQKKYFILRFAELSAHHDTDRTGITKQVAKKIVGLLEPQGSVFITSERELEPEFEKFRIDIHPKDMHHALFFAEIFIGDSQTMAAEAAVLGTPSVRFNDFVGKLGYLEELEHKYGLTFGIKTSEPEKLYYKINELLNTPKLKNIFEHRKRKMIDEKIDVTAFFTWLIENYPDSTRIMRENPNYQYRFRSTPLINSLYCQKNPG